MTISHQQDRPLPDSSHKSTEQSSRSHLKQAIKEFLTEASSSLRQPSKCPRCGRAMQHLNATFSIYGSDTRWKIALPVCPCSIPADISRRKLAENVFLPES